MTPEQEPLTAWTVVRWLLDALGALAVMVLSMLNGRLKKVEAGHEQLQQQVRELDVQKVSRDTHHEHEKDVRDMLRDMDKKGEDRGERIFQALAELGKRVDGLYQRHER